MLKCARWDSVCHATYQPLGQCLSISFWLLNTSSWINSHRTFKVTVRTEMSPSIWPTESCMAWGRDHLIIDLFTTGYRYINGQNIIDSPSDLLARGQILQTYLRLYEISYVDRTYWWITGLVVPKMSANVCSRRDLSSCIFLYPEFVFISFFLWIYFVSPLFQLPQSNYLDVYDLPKQNGKSSSSCPTTFSDLSALLTDEDTRAWMKDRQKKDNHNISKSPISVKYSQQFVLLFPLE